MFRLLAGGFALAFLALTATPTGADDKKDKEKFTVWTRDINELTLKFEIGQKTAKYHVIAGENGCIITAKIKIEKDVITSEITDVELKGNFNSAPKKGAKFSFKWEAKGDTAMLLDLKGDDVEDAKDYVQGEYKKKK